MTKEEARLSVMGAISMALKDPTLQQGFEIICKNLAELKKENAELKEKLGDVQMQKAGEKSNLVWKLKTTNEQKADQLTKAREIILRLYNAGRDVLMCREEEKAYDNLSNAINDKSIAQFLSEVEK